MDRKNVFMGVLAVALVISLIWGNQQRSGLEAYRAFLENQYHRSFYELVDTVENLEVRLAKMMVTASPNQTIVTLSEIWRQSNAAQEQLSRLPIDEPGLGSTVKFINQLGDYAYVLTKKAAGGTLITPEEMEQLALLHNQCSEVYKELNLLRNHVQNGLVTWGQNPFTEANPPAPEAQQPVEKRQFNAIEQTVVEYPTLIYDGPFADSVQDTAPKGLPDQPTDEAGALAVAAAFLGDRAGELTAQATEGLWPGWTCSQPGLSVHVAGQGSVVVWMIEDLRPVEAKYQLNECVEFAQIFLKERGFEELGVTFWQINDGIAVINFAAMQNDILMYPDLIKIKVAMDDGRIVGYEAGNYWMNHVARQLEPAQITIEEARGYVSPQLEITNQRLVLIPTETRGERLCYEFEGHFAEETFMVYINAESGREENILKIIDTGNGSLAI